MLTRSFQLPAKKVIIVAMKMMNFVATIWVDGDVTLKIVDVSGDVTLKIVDVSGDVTLKLVAVAGNLR